MNTRQELAHLTIVGASILTAATALGSLGFFWLTSIYN
jgi:hypothetical protein